MLKIKNVVICLSLILVNSAHAKMLECEGLDIIDNSRVALFQIEDNPVTLGFRALDGDYRGTREYLVNVIDGQLVLADTTYNTFNTPPERIELSYNPRSRSEFNAKLTRRVMQSEGIGVRETSKYKLKCSGKIKTIK